MLDIEIVQKILEGDTGLYKLIVDRYSKMCFSIAYRIISDAEDSQDIVQDSFIAAYEHLKTFRQDAKFSTWLYRITMNKALAAKNKTSFYDDVGSVQIESEEYPDELDIYQAQQLKAALNALNEKERLVIDLFYYQEQSIRDMSYICQTSESNIKVMLHRARKKMQEICQEPTKFAQR